MRSDVVPQGLPAWAVRVAGALVCVAGAACAGTARPALGPPPAKETRAVLAGGLCGDNRCSCREVRPGSGDGGVGVPDPGKKRYEIRLGPSPYELWVTINGSSVLYKSAERADECFYVDLPSGEQHVELRASNPSGVSVALQVHELGTSTKSWYDTFAFRCGSPGVCSFEELDDTKAEYEAAKRNLYDACGTTKVKKVSWDHGKSPDQLHPSELLLRFTLDIYNFAAWKPHGDPTCGPGGGRPPDEPVPPPAETP